MLETLYNALIHPYLTLGLSFLVLYKWVLRTIYQFEWRYLGGITARLLFCVIYASVIYYQPSNPELRYLVRIGLNLLFLDEVINWGTSWNGKLIRKLDRKTKEIKKLNGTIRE